MIIRPCCIVAGVWGKYTLPVPEGKINQAWLKASKSAHAAKMSISGIAGDAALRSGGRNPWRGAMQSDSMHQRSVLNPKRKTQYAGSAGGWRT
jgi:hypothetical protein